MLRIMIGFDPAETVAYHVLCQSILSRASQPVAFTPINKRNIKEFTRGIEDGSTEFSFSRFLTPFLAGYQGKALFMDCDIIVRDDIAKLFAEAKGDHDVWCVKHNYTPKGGTKFLGNVQHIYPKKNWSSVMLFDCSRCNTLTPEIVNHATGSFLHRFEWADSVGDLSQSWNHLVGEYEPNEDARLVHYTLGTPCFKGYENQEFADEWFAEHEVMNSHE